MSLRTMTFGENLQSFGGKPVQEFETGKGLADPANFIPRVSWDWDSPAEVTDLLAEIFRDPRCEELTGLVIGHFGEESYEEPPTAILEAVLNAAPRLPNLDTFFLGDMTYEQNEISWIYHTDVSPVWEAFPQLKHVGIRGTNDLKLGVMELPELESLILQTGGMPSAVIEEVLNAQLPSLNHLELFLGDSGYGWDGTAETVRPLLFSNPFPQLRYLGLRNSEIVDDICQILSGAPVLNQLHTLDLSLGTLSDTGGKALVAAEGIKQLKKLDLHHNFLSDAVMNELRGLGIEVNLEDSEGPDAEYRYVAHSE